MADETPENIKITSKLATVVDSRRAAELFARILRAVREQRKEDEQKKHESAA